MKFLAIISMCTIAILFTACPLAAEMYQVDFSVEIDAEDALGGQTFFGSAIYDSTSVIGNDIERVELTSFDFLYDGISYDKTDDTNDGWPAAYFYNGIFEGIEFRGYSSVPTQVELMATIGPDMFFEREGQIYDFGSGPFFNPGSTINSGTVTFSQPTVVPEPATLSLIALGSIAAIHRRRHA